MFGSATTMIFRQFTFGDGALLNQAKVGILVAAIVADIGGWLVLSRAGSVALSGVAPTAPATAPAVTGREGV